MITLMQAADEQVLNYNVAKMSNRQQHDLQLLFTLARQIKPAKKEVS